MNDTILYALILVPVVAGGLALLSRGAGRLKEAIALLVTLANLVAAIYLFSHVGDFTGTITLPIWTGAGLEFTLRLYQFSSFILLAAAGFAFLVTVYSCSFMKDKPYANQFYAYLLISMGMVAGAVLADNLVLLLFFWEGLLGTLFGMIAIGRPGAFKTAVKAFVIVGVTDLCMMLGIALTGFLARQSGGGEHFLNMTTISGLGLTATGMGGAAMILMMIGAISKAGSMPFHSWIPDAAVDAPLPFMAFLPASLEKLLGIYFLTRISMDMFHVQSGTWTSLTMMIVGALTILLAVMMALVQKDYKRLLSYHAISQVGYMVLGVGTGSVIGIVGGLFHMINHAMYKSCLFLTAGSVEKQAGTTSLEKLGGLGRKMPVTFACFIIAAAAISGAPPLNGFFSKELIYDAALSQNVVFYIAALLGTFLTAASFLKLGHSAFLGKRDPANDSVREAPLPILAPMIVIAAGCVFFGLWNYVPLNHLIEPVVRNSFGAGAWAASLQAVGFEHTTADGVLTFAGVIPHNWLLAAMTLVAIIGALFNHLLGVRINGSGLAAVDHIHYAPILETIYDKADKQFFDPYRVGMVLVGYASKLAWWIDRLIDWLTDTAAVSVTSLFSGSVRWAHNGNYSRYLLWSLVGTLAVIAILVSYL
jgi:NADH-quinone oxidoreductase subunit L